MWTLSIVLNLKVTAFGLVRWCMVRNWVVAQNGMLGWRTLFPGQRWTSVLGFWGQSLSHTESSISSPGPGWKMLSEMLLFYVWERDNRMYIWAHSLQLSFIVTTDSRNLHNCHPTGFSDPFPECLLWENSPPCPSPSCRRVPGLCSRKMFQFTFPPTAWEGHSPGGSLSGIFCSLQCIIFRDVPSF